MSFLSKEEFSFVIKSTPLVAIDLIIEDGEKNVLLGKRKNEPAKGFLFVPGGRILKEESLEEALLRITKDEVGTAYPFSSAIFLGVYEHFYENNVFESEDFSTHYVVLAYKINVCEEDLKILPNSQHSEFNWIRKQDLLRDSEVHDNTKAYFY